MFSAHSALCCTHCTRGMKAPSPCTHRKPLKPQTFIPVPSPHLSSAPSQSLFFSVKLGQAAASQIRADRAADERTPGSYPGQPVRLNSWPHSCGLLLPPADDQMLPAASCRLATPSGSALPHSEPFFPGCYCTGEQETTLGLALRAHLSNTSSSCSSKLQVLGSVARNTWKWLTHSSANPLEVCMAL